MIRQIDTRAPFYDPCEPTRDDRAPDKLDNATALRALGDIHAEASAKARRYASRPDLGKRFERAALYAANARAFWQAALMAEGSHDEL